MRTRRSFLSRLSVGMAAFGGTIAVAGQSAQAQTAGSGAWQPVRHPEDDWLDQVPGKHRLVIDTTTAENFGQALLFAVNYLRLNRATYGLQDADLAVLLIARHRATAFGFNDAMWAKYGSVFTQRTNFNDPTTQKPPTVNVYNSQAYGFTLANGGALLSDLLARGVQLAVCEVATRTAASNIAAATGGNFETLYAELVDNRFKPSRMVPAGIVTVNRAQERGYSFAYAG